MTLDPSKLSASIDKYFTEFKTLVAKKIQNGENINDIGQFISEYSFPDLVQEDYTKRRRIKNVIPFHEKCIAKRATGEQCSRRKKAGSEFCGTHSKACPHGVVNMQPETHEVNDEGEKIVKKQIEVWLEDINGIMYWINDSGTVYHPDDINKNVENPRVIAHYEKKLVDDMEIYKIIGEIH